MEPQSNSCQARLCHPKSARGPQYRVQFSREGPFLDRRQGLLARPAADLTVAAIAMPRGMKEKNGAGWGRDGATHVLICGGSRVV
jgi:hypothetical protein